MASIYFQCALGYNGLESGALILPLVVMTAIASISGGQFMARVGQYMPLVVSGYFLWSVGTGLTCMFDRETGLGKIIGILLLEGCGVGLTLQPSNYVCF